MRIRPIWIVAGAAALLTGCANSPTEPQLSCDGNPKCEAHPTPLVPTTLEPMTPSTTESTPMTCRVRIGVRCTK